MNQKRIFNVLLPLKYKRLSSFLLEPTKRNTTFCLEKEQKFLAKCVSNKFLTPPKLENQGEKTLSKVKK